MTELIITRGLPASGKTTFALNWIDDDPANRVRVNRDDMRVALYGRPVDLTYQQEQAVTTAQHSAVEALLRAGKSVVVDDTNLRLKHARAWVDLAVTLGVEWRVEDIDTPLTTCLRQDLQRGIAGHRTVGGDVIHDFNRRYARPWPEAVPSEVVAPWVPEPYVPDVMQGAAWIVDIDGTIAHNDGHRGWYEWAAVGGDSVKDTIVDLVRSLHQDRWIVLVSGRDASCRSETVEWLRDNDIPYDELYMRPEGDNRRDDLVKAELFDQHVRHRFNVQGVLDDRDQVVAMWRAMGLTCLQVAPGNF